MQRLKLAKCFLLLFSIFFIPYILCTPMDNMNIKTPSVMDCKNLIRDLRESWQSPISYLRKRGYIPKGSDDVLEEKLNALQKEEKSNDKNNNNDYTPNLFEDDTKNSQSREDSLAISPIDGLTNLQPMPIQTLQRPHNKPKPAQAPAHHKEPGFFRKMKDKFVGIFSSKKSGTTNQKQKKPATYEVTDDFSTNDFENRDLTRDLNMRDFEKDDKTPEKIDYKYIDKNLEKERDTMNTVVVNRNEGNIY